MFLRLETLTPRKLIGQHVTMSLSANKTGELWRGFIQRRKEITNNPGTDLWSLQILPENYFDPFDPGTLFEKWAAIEVNSFHQVPEGMETFVVPGGLYAVFLHKGAAATGPQTFRYVIGTWLPASGYMLDDRPHFEILGEKYRNDHPDSEEEIWIPLKVKSAL